MSVIVVAGGKGAPGATTTAIGVAATWPTAERLLIEADPDGGVLAARFGLAYEPGLVTFAASLRGATDGALGPHLQRLDGGVSVLCAPTRPDQVTGAFRTAGPVLARALAGVGEVAAVVDVGRAWPTAGSVEAVVAAADVVLLVCRPRLDEVQQLGARLGAFRGVARGVQVVLVGEAPYSRTEIEAALGGAGEVVVEVLPVEARTAEMLNGQRVTADRWLRRAGLMRGFASLTERLAAELREGSDAVGSMPRAAARPGDDLVIADVEVQG